MRLKLIKQGTSFDFFSRWKIWLGISALLVIVGFVSFAIQGLNFGIDFRGGTTIRTESTQPVDIGVYRDALTPLGLGDISITEVFDPQFDADQHVTQIRIEAQEGDEAVQGQLIEDIAAALKAADPGMKLPFPAVESVGPKVSGELIQTAAIAVVLAIGAVLIAAVVQASIGFGAGMIILPILIWAGIPIGEILALMSGAVTAQLTVKLWLQ